MSGSGFSTVVQRTRRQVQRGKMDLSRAVYSRDLKIAAMRALGAGATTCEIGKALFWRRD